MFKVRRLLECGRYQWWQPGQDVRGQWTDYEIDGYPFEDKYSAAFIRDVARENSQRPDVVYHAVVPCQ
jgi:hypothetical protein